MSVSILHLDIGRKGQLLALLAAVVVCLSVVSCHDNSSQTADVVDETLSKTYLSIIEEMTTLMNEPGDGAMQLEKIRTYVQSNTGRLTQEIGIINSGILDLDEAKRSALLAQTTPKIEASLERFAQAQIALRARMTESEQWELGEALGMFR